MTVAIETDRLTRIFPSGRALDGVSLSVPAGEVLALLGPNGAGKTTTVRLLNGVLRPDEGRASVLGLDPELEGHEVRRRTGVLTENAGLDDRLTTRENLSFTARMRGFSKKEGAQRVDEMLERFGMADRADDLTQGFSTGQRKRVALARALLHDPEVLFLDEPTSGLDPAGTRDVSDLIQSLAGEGRTIVLATHFLGEAGRLADQMAVLHRGRLEVFGRPTELAGDLWRGMGAAIDTGAALDERRLARLRALPGVHEASAAPEGVWLRVEAREVLARVVAALVGDGVPVYEARAHAPSLEDVYFEIERRIVARTGEQLTDGFLGDSVERWSTTYEAMPQPTQQEGPR
jgi:ABC-2 type transport system ATP-binding protein